jgi:AraC-like DNA-binding protein
LLLLFSIYLLSLRPGRIHFPLLAGFFLSRVFILAGSVIWHYNVVAAVPDLAFFYLPFLYLYAPFLYLYLKSVSTPGFRLRLPLLLHFLPAIFVAVSLLFAFNLSEGDKSTLLLHPGAYLAIVTNITWVWIQFFVYAAGCIYLLIRYRSRLKRYFSSLEELNLSWLSFLVCAFLLWKAIYLSGYLFDLFDSPYAVFFKIFIEVGFLVYASLIILKGLQMSEVFKTIGDDKKYRTSPLKDTDIRRYLDKIENTMNEQKPYLQPALTLKELSKKTAIPPHYISQILNEALKLKFYDYINTFRIEESKRILADPGSHKKTILEVLYDVGFNSKSVFNEAFKKQVGMTPREYKRSFQRQN